MRGKGNWGCCRFRDEEPEVVKNHWRTDLRRKKRGQKEKGRYFGIGELDIEEGRKKKAGGNEIKLSNNFFFFTYIQPRLKKQWPKEGTTMARRKMEELWYRTIRVLMEIILGLLIH